MQHGNLLRSVCEITTARCNPHHWRDCPSERLARPLDGLDALISLREDYFHRRWIFGSDMKNFLWPRAILPGTPNPVCIRTAVESDIDKLTAHFERLSQSARYNRFMGAVGNFSRIARDCAMPKRKADFFTLVMEWREADFDSIIGEACYGFDRESGSGEFAISVGDRFQRHGLGSTLLCALQSRAVSLGHRDLFGETLKNNNEMRRLARRAGFAFSRSPDWRAVRFAKRLAG
jgi:RimJ/RimL family protein N-acetyltransferase